MAAEASTPSPKSVKPFTIDGEPSLRTSTKFMSWPSQMMLSSCRMENPGPSRKSDHWSDRLLLNKDPQQEGPSRQKLANVGDRDKQGPSTSAYSGCDIIFNSTCDKNGKRAKFIDDSGPVFHSNSGRNPQHAMAQMPAFKDGFVRVSTTSHMRQRPGMVSLRLPSSHQGGKSSKRRGSLEEDKSKILFFGETDYLRDKLGFTMPLVRQTLSSETKQLEATGAQLGLSQISKQRLLTIKGLFQERTSMRQQQQRFSRRDIKPQQLGQSTVDVRESRRRSGSLEAQQYIVLLDANTRRAKHVDDRAKFAFSKEMCRQESRRLTLDRIGELDSQLLLSTKIHLEAERERLRRKEKERRVKIMMPRKSQGSEDSDESF